MNDAVLAARGLTKIYGGTVRALDGVDLSVGDGGLAVVERLLRPRGTG